MGILISLKEKSRKTKHSILNPNMKSVTSCVNQKLVEKLQKLCYPLSYVVTFCALCVYIHKDI